MITTELYQKGKGQTPSVWLVKRDDQVIGLVEKFVDHRSNRNPYKAFLVDGAAAGKPNTMLGVFYAPGVLTGTSWLPASKAEFDKAVAAVEEATK